MNLDIDTLLASVTAELPGGSALDYDADFLELEREMRGVPEQQYGETLVRAQDPNWPAVLQMARALLVRSKDFRLAVVITRALARLHGPRGIEEGLTLVIAMTRRYWHDGHPTLLDDGEEDLLPRSNALADLAAMRGLPDDLRCAEVSSRQLGKLPLGTLERIAQSRGDAGSEPLQREQLPRFLRDELESGNQDLLALPRVRERIHELRDLLLPSLGVEHTPDFTGIIGLIDLITPTGSGCEHPGQPEAPPAPASLTTDGPGTSKANSRSDAIAMLDEVCEYLERSEPANPAPLLIRRARKMIGQDFLAILRDLAPAGVQQAETIAGLTRQE